MEHTIAASLYAQARAQLVLRGTSITAWAKSHGHQHRYVIDVLRRWDGRRGRPTGRMLRNPKGKKAIAILRDLRRTLPDLVPADLVREARLKSAR